MISLFSLFREKGWKVDHGVWQEWSGLVCNALLTHSERSEIADQWTRILLRLSPDDEVPAGWKFDEEMGRRLFELRKPMVMGLVQSHEAGRWVGDQNIHNLVLWLRETMETWDSLEAAGLVCDKDKQWWKDAQKQAMGQEWHKRTHEAILNMKVEPDHDKILLATWSKWNSRELLGIANTEHKDEGRRLKF